jgi:hypothetical protein
MIVHMYAYAACLITPTVEELAPDEPDAVQGYNKLPPFERQI